LRNVEQLSPEDRITAFGDWIAGPGMGATPPATPTATPAVTRGMPPAASMPAATAQQ
jgi:hypothetical protein